MYFADFVRVNSILWLTAIICRYDPCSSRVGRDCAPHHMALSLMIIIGYIIPAILIVMNPLCELQRSVVLLAVTLYRPYGWNLKTHAAVLRLALFFAPVPARCAICCDHPAHRLVEMRTPYSWLQMLTRRSTCAGFSLAELIIGALVCSMIW